MCRFTCGMHIAAHPYVILIFREFVYLLCMNFLMHFEFLEDFEKNHRAEPDVKWSCRSPNKPVHSGKKLKILGRAYARLLGTLE